MKERTLLPVFALAASLAFANVEDPRIPEVPAADFDRLLTMIKPQPGESPWREVEWLTDVTEARRRSVAEGKPLVIFTAADGSPLGRTWGACTSNRARWFTGKKVEPAYVTKHFIPLALDTYFRGNSQELEFCKKAGAGGNRLVAVTAGGRKLGAEAGRHLYLREEELAPILAEFRALPDAEREVSIGDAGLAIAPKRPVPNPPPGGLVVRGYCTYLKAGEGGRPVRAQNFYYERNPDRWLAETQSDMLWLTEVEWKTLLPKDLTPGRKIEVAAAIQQRFFATIGIDYMEGSVNALVPRRTEMSIAVRSIEGGVVTLQLDGYGEMGKELSDTNKGDPRSRGCAVRVSGKLVYDAEVGDWERFDVVGIGKAWGNKMEYTRREIGIEGYPWIYGIACELVTGDSAIDRIPPYNLLHYGGAVPYFSKK